ncbi:MAG: hypothetical protein V2B19_05870 [Pseudomonadota bacterium]
MSDWGLGCNRGGESIICGNSRPGLSSGWNGGAPQNEFQPKEIDHDRPVRISNEWGLATGAPPFY